MKALPGHGVLLSLKNKGVFLIGKSGIGKSETALQLIHQGAVLVCDDAPDFTVDEVNKAIIGACPQGFDGLMHLRDIGIINLIDLLGQQYCKKKQKIDYVIELVQSNDQKCSEVNLSENQTIWQYKHKQLVLSLPGISIHMAPNRNIPLLVQIAIAQFKLKSP